MTVQRLLEPSRTDLFGFHRPYAHPHPPSTDFVQVIKSLRSAAILGVSIKGQGLHPRGGPGDGRADQPPVIFALSNPTDHAECTAVQFPPVRLGGKTFVTGQTNNLYIFPAIGLAIFATRAPTGVPGELSITAATAVAGQVTRAELGSGLLYPPQSNILQTKIATAVRGVRGHSSTVAWPAMAAPRRHPRRRRGPAVHPECHDAVRP